MFPFTGKKALVAGGSGGIGRFVSFALAESGASLRVIGRDREKLESLLSELPRCGAPPGMTGMAAHHETEMLDLSSAGAAERCAAFSPDILAVCHGPFLQKPLHECGSADWSAMAGLNLALPGSLVSLVLPAMMKRGWGRILLFGGTRTDTVRGYRTNAAYAAAKTALGVLAKSVAAEYSRFGISCVVVCPGFVRTEFVGPETARSLEALSPTGRLQDPRAVARAAVDLLLPDPPLANGAVVTLDGGLPS